MPNFAKVSETKAGDVLVADGSFTCISAGAKRTVQQDKNGALWIGCNDGRHYLEGQADDANRHYVGLYRAAT